MPAKGTDVSRFIIIVGSGTLPKAIEAVIGYIFEERKPHIQYVEPEAYQRVRAAVVPDLVIVTDCEHAADIVTASGPEFFVVCYTDHEREQAEAHSGFAAIARPVGQYNELSETIAELLY